MQVDSQPATGELVCTEANFALVDLLKNLLPLLISAYFSIPTEKCNCCMLYCFVLVYVSMS